MKTKKWAIGLMILCTVFTSTAQLLYKSGVENFNLSLILLNWQILTGLFLYGIGAILVIIALKYGEVSVLYPIITSSYIWVALGSHYFFNESINSIRWLGIILIIIGILFITIKQDSKKTTEYPGAI